MKGFAFKCHLGHYVFAIEDIEDSKLSNMTLDPLQNLTIVTYASDDHFPETKMMLYLWRYKYPKIPIIFYSLGLTNSQKSELSKVCLLTVREFDFAKYPPHVKILQNYAFKMAILGEVYKTNEFFYLMDSSLRPFNSSAFLDYIEASYVEKVCKQRMYSYLPIQKELNDRIQFAGGSILVKRSAFSSQIIKWALLCAMTDECISPVGSFRECDFPKGITTCHRYDQSMLNILLYNALQESPDWDKMVLDWPYNDAESVRRENQWNFTLPKEILCI
ncbi:unnamed protein product, partial [Mesorhabditis belari]|uniref:Uncharacterized protein n=1 Tax=Mesorhabditis belari TaxID=2138241 RepID=A0AAF3EH19_9BILA